MRIANFFNRPHYTSDTTDFVQHLRDQDPGLEQRQREGRGLLWDQQLDRDLLGEFKAGSVPMTSYVYYNWDGADE